MREHELVELSGGTRLSYAEYGDPAGRPLMYFHGWPSSRLQARLFQQLAAGRGLRVISPDRPGMGESTFQPGRELLDWPPLLREFAEALGIDRFSILGVSGGGPYVLACAHAIPEHIHAAAVVSGAPPLADPANRREINWWYRAMIKMRRIGIWTSALTFAFGRLALFCGPQHPLIRLLMLNVPQCDRDAISDREVYQCFVDSTRLALGSGARQLVTDSEIYLADWKLPLEEIELPIHLWHGGLDRNLPLTTARRIAEALPNAITHWEEDEGHFSLALERMEEILDALFAR